MGDGSKKDRENPLPGAKSAFLGFPQVKHLFKRGVPVGLLVGSPEATFVGEASPTKLAPQWGG
jgi:hypothetical protein